MGSKINFRTPVPTGHPWNLGPVKNFPIAPIIIIRDKPTCSNCNFSINIIQTDNRRVYVYAFRFQSWNHKQYYLLVLVPKMHSTINAFLFLSLKQDILAYLGTFRERNLIFEIRFVQNMSDDTENSTKPHFILHKLSTSDFNGELLNSTYDYRHPRLWQSNRTTPTLHLEMFRTICQCGISHMLQKLCDLPYFSTLLSLWHSKLSL